MHKSPPADNAQHTTALSAQSVTTGNASLPPEQGLPPVDEFAQQMQQRYVILNNVAQQIEQRVNDRSNFIKVEPFKDHIEKGLAMEEPRVLYPFVITKGETTILFGDTAIGKTTLAMMMAMLIAEREGQTVLYVNFELSQQQLAQRFKEKDIPGNFYIATIDYSLMNDVKDQTHMLAAIEEKALAIDADVIFIDNLTNLCVNSKDGAEAGQLMLQLLTMRMAHEWTLVVLAHVPKRKQTEPLTLNDLAGSKIISNLADNVIGFNRSKKDKDTRYIIQLKWRSGPLTLDEHNVQELLMTNSDGWLHFEFGARDEEFRHLPRSRDEKMELEMEIIKELKKSPNKSYRVIAAELGTSATKITHVAKANGLSRSDIKA